MASRTACPAGRDVFEYMSEQGWSDGLPLVPPTPARVKHMLTGTARNPAEILGHCAPIYGEVTVMKVAINAVMAGCTPQHLRLVLAAVEAMLTDEFNVHGVHATTMGATPAVIVHGPARQEAGLALEHGALGSSGTRANTTIGRALKLLLQNCGGARLAKTESTTLGSPSKLSLCLAEAEEAAPRWEPYHVAADGQSAVTLLAVTGGPCQLVDFKTSTALSLCEQYAALVCPLYSATMPCLNDVLLVVSPEHYATLVGGGVASKTKLKAAVWHLANRELGARIRAPVALAMPGAAGLIVGWVLLVACWCCELAGSLLLLLFPGSWMRIVPIFSLAIGKIAPKLSSVDSIHVVVSGAHAGKFSAVLPGFGIGKAGQHPSAHMSRPVTRIVEPPPPALAAADDAPPPASKDATLLLPTFDRPIISPLKATARTAPLKGRVALLDISKPNGNLLLDTIEKQLAKYDVTCTRYSKPAFAKPLPREMAERIAATSDAAIIALAD